MFKNIKTAKQVEQERLDGLSEQAKAKRDRLLAETDYMMMPDYPMDDREAMKAYRQALRDITKQDGFPEKAIFPDMPA